MDNCPKCGEPTDSTGHVCGPGWRLPNGWICPKCESVFAPSVTECYRCNPPKPEEPVSNAIDTFVGSSHAGHLIVKCRHCHRVIKQCRCPGPKPVWWDTCDDCAAAGKTAKDAELLEDKDGNG